MNTRVFFVTDVHGSERCFKKFLNAGKFYKANAVMLAGDITGKMIVPIVKQPDGTYLSSYAGSDLRCKSEVEERLSDAGIKCFISPGNDDRWEVDSALNKSTIIINPEEKVVELDQHHEMISLGLTNHTPWNSPREFDEPELAERIDKMAAGVKNMGNWLCT